ncbi:succinate dehydrogenase cytochrome b subunit [Roseimarinus sediminis]|uniref:succinate dehydrogenase cytochrome b subunit n=1 Tax=Roseimarinus sediminis TaxID=1610899 RepID=UPI003D1B0DEA
MSKGSFLSASIGRKFLMSITGLFLVSFIVIHLSINLLLIFDDSGELFNVAAHFMATNALIKVMEPVLALGFIIHIIWSLMISVQNMKARPIGYNKSSQRANSTWASRNMLILGALILVFLGLHIYDFWWKIKVSGSPLLEMSTGLEEGVHNTYALVSTLFMESTLYNLIYIAGGILLGLHITHGFWSAFQTIGLSNDIWRKRLYVLANIIGWIFAIGFSVIPIYFMIKF